MSTENVESTIEDVAEEPQLAVKQGPGPVRQPQRRLVAIGHCGRPLRTHEMAR